MILDEVAFWWTTTKKGEDIHVNAQLLHPDRGRLCPLKFLRYLTYGDTNTGTHLYVRGQRSKKPSSLCADRRTTDDAVRAAGRSVDYCEFRTGSTGAIRPVPRWEGVAADSSW